MPQTITVLAAACLTLLSLFTSRLGSKIQTSNPITVIAAGDTMLGRSINFKAYSKNDYTFPFVDTKDFLSSADITLINLETPLSQNCPPTNSGMVFCADDRHLHGLILSGVDVVSLANNHAFDLRESGFLHTSELLERSGIKTIYPNHPAKITIRNCRISIHAFNDVWSWSKQYSKVDDKQMSAEIFEAQKTSDIVIVMFHWGDEYTEKITDRQIQLARLAIDSGADLIIGSHPHWIQKTETYNNKIIDYSLGNFVFDQYWSEKTRQGQIAKYSFHGSNLTHTEYVPVYQRADGHTIQK